MPWVLVDIAISVLALVVLGLVGFRTFRHAKSLLKAAGGLGEVSGQMAALQVPRPAPQRSPARRG